MTNQRHTPDPLFRLREARDFFAAWQPTFVLTRDQATAFARTLTEAHDALGAQTKALADALTGIVEIVDEAGLGNSPGRARAIELLLRASTALSAAGVAP